MILDFFIQILYGFLFFFGMAGIGFVILDFFKIENRNIFFKTASSYFVSLCLYVFGAVVGLFVVPNKLLFLTLFTVFYILTSYFVIFFYIKKENISLAKMKEFFRDRWPIFAALLICLFLFFLLTYNTSILDEYLHRPVVKYFTTNGEFPLINPLKPQSDFIGSYHYGMHIVSSAVQLITKIGISESLDIVKISYFITTFFLFYGLVFWWSRRKWFSLGGAVSLIFSGGFFFFLDAFTTSYFYKIKWMEHLWVMNVPLAFTITGITWINIPLTVAFIFIIKDFFEKSKKFKILPVIILNFIFLGIFLISELFAVLLLVAIGFLLVQKIIKKEINPASLILPFIIFCLILFSGLYVTEGVPGKMIKDNFQKLVSINKNEASSKNVSNVRGDKNKPLLSLRPISEWGYASESNIINVWKHPAFYLRNFFLEVVLLTLFFYGIYRKKVMVKGQGLLLFLTGFTFTVPFVFSTSMGDLNFYKLTSFGIILFHLLAFYYISKIYNRKLVSLLLIIFFLGSFPAMSMGFNVQWRIFSSKGGEIYSSQNPLTYKKDIIAFLGKFEEENPGPKYVLTSGGLDAQKIVDLTNSCSVVASKIDLSYDYLMKNNIQYIFTSPNSKNDYSVEELENDARIRQIITDGKYAIYKVN